MKKLPIKEAKHLIRAFLLWRKFAGITIPYFGIYLLKEQINNPALIRHERKHEEQINQLGVIRFVLAYWYFCSKYGYYLNQLEIEARSVE